MSTEIERLRHKITKRTANNKSSVKSQRKLEKLLKSMGSVEEDGSTQMETDKQTEMPGTSLLLFYAYVEPEWTLPEYNAALEWAQRNAELHEITGRLRIAHEGFNGTMTGSFTNMRAWCQAMREWQPRVFGATQFKITDGLPDGQAFPYLKLIPCKELVNYGLAGQQPSLKMGGTHLEPQAYHEKLQESNTVVIDVRNSYEAQIGHFMPPEGGAEYIDPEMRVSTEFPEWVDKNVDRLKGKQIMMFCTGGIRCERASALLKTKGLENVFQMQGGVHRYLEEFSKDGGLWKGHNYTFDKRFLHGAEQADIMGECVACCQPWNKYRGKRRCPPCGVPLLICDNCQESSTDAVCHLCKKAGLTCKCTND